MRVIRLLTIATVAALVGTTAACATTVTGRGTLAEGVLTPAPTSTDSPSPTSTDSPSPTETESPSPTETPSPTVDPVKTKRQVLCVLLQATVKTTNDKFNAAKSREQQVSILRSGATSTDGALRRSGLNLSDRIYAAGFQILRELQKLVSAANRGANPSTTPYNTATSRFRTACVSL